MLEARDLSYSKESLERFLPELREWRGIIQSYSEGLSEGRQDLLLIDGRERLTARMSRIEDMLHDALSSGSDDTPVYERDESLYRMLGALRGVTEAYVAVIGGRVIDWPRLRETRF